jgi:hypothetical protein
MSSQADRVAKLLEIIDLINKGRALAASTFATVLVHAEVQTRARFKPCFAEGKWFPTTIAAAHYLAHHRRDLWVNSAAAARMDAHAVMENLRNRVKNWCNADNRVGYYWADPEGLQY